jgi:NAD-dependent deacetylase
MREEIAKAAEYLLSSRHTVALTGAGISVESGIPPFRGPGSLWEKFDPMEYAHINAFLKDPEKIWKTLIAEMRDVLMNASPNAGHFGLARLEDLGLMGTVVIEFHGNFAWLSCLECGFRKEITQVNAVDIPPRCDCCGIFRPDCVFFGELIPPEALDRSQQASARCDVMLVVGTSATVQPAAYMPVIARQRGAVIIEINPEPTPLTGTTSQVLVQGKAGEVMNELVSAVESLKK